MSWGTVHGGSNLAFKHCDGYRGVNLEKDLTGHALCVGALLIVEMYFASGITRNDVITNVPIKPTKA